jgi:hypothetical protein
MSGTAVMLGKAGHVDGAVVGAGGKASAAKGAGSADAGGGFAEAVKAAASLLGDAKDSGAVGRQGSDLHAESSGARKMETEGMPAQGGEVMKDLLSAKDSRRAGDAGSPVRQAANEESDNGEAPIALQSAMQGVRVLVNAVLQIPKANDDLVAKVMTDAEVKGHKGEIGSAGKTGKAEKAGTAKAKKAAVDGPVQDALSSTAVVQSAPCVVVAGVLPVSASSSKHDAVKKDDAVSVGAVKQASGAVVPAVPQAGKQAVARGDETSQAGEAKGGGKQEQSSDTAGGHSSQQEDDRGSVAVSPTLVSREEFGGAAAAAQAPLRGAEGVAHKAASSAPLAGVVQAAGAELSLHGYDASSPNKLEVSVIGGSFGLLNVRAELTADGDVHTTLRGTDVAAAELQPQVHAIASYLNQQDVPVKHVAVETFRTMPAAQMTFAGGDQGSGLAQGNEQQQQRRQSAQMSQVGEKSFAEDHAEAIESGVLGWETLTQTQGTGAHSGRSLASTGGWLSVRV